MKKAGRGNEPSIESSSSCALLAQLLATTKHDVNIITNSVFIANYIRNRKNGSITLLGGDFQRESQVCIGPLIRTAAKEFYVDKFFLGTDGFAEIL